MNESDGSGKFFNGSNDIIVSWSGEIGSFSVAIDGGAAQSTGLKMRGATAPSMNRDGKRILFSAQEDKAELWALPNVAQR